MKYSEFAPTPFDSKGAFLDDRQDWLVAPISQNRDSECLSRSNFEKGLEMLGGESDDVEIHRFGHWGPGWFELVIVRPGSPAETIALDMEKRLENYPCLDEEDFCEKEHEEANEIWANCYNWRDRIKYIRAHESEFKPRDFRDLIACVRGEYFLGCASELSIR